MPNHHTRRDVLRGTLAAAGLGMLGIPEWALPALAQGETVVPFTDVTTPFPPPKGDATANTMSARSMARSRPPIGSLQPNTTAIRSSNRRPSA